MFRHVALVFVLAASPAQAGQPLYVSMAECAGLMQALVDQITTPSPRRDRVVGAAGNWTRAAHEEAGRDISDLISKKEAAWRDKGPTVVFTEEFRDWAGYCRSLARHKGLKIDPGA